MKPTLCFFPTLWSLLVFCEWKQGRVTCVILRQKSTTKPDKHGSQRIFKNNNTHPALMWSHHSRPQTGVQVSFAHANRQDDKLSAFENGSVECASYENAVRNFLVPHSLCAQWVSKEQHSCLCTWHMPMHVTTRLSFILASTVVCVLMALKYWETGRSHFVCVVWFWQTFTCCVLHLLVWMH